MVSITRICNEDRTEKLGITLPIRLLQKSDSKGGDIPRSKYIRRAIESYLKGRFQKTVLINIQSCC
jgi:metal-responsive CopG/Arc/MetJ family transcriptional regulator